jgi:hypothetical protein
MSIHHLEDKPFDRNEATATFLAAAGKQTVVRQKLPSPVNWPTGLIPTALNSFGNFKPGVKITSAVTVPTDVLMLQFTDEETQALLDVFTGNDTWDAQRKDQWYPYAHNFGSLSSQIGGISKSEILATGVFGYLFPMQIGTKTVALYKTQLHPKNDGNKVPFIPVIKQLVGELAPKLVITTGTAGAIGPKLNCGDVVITDTAGLHCRGKYPSLPELNTITNNHAQLQSRGQMSVDASKIQFVQDHFIPLGLPGLDESFGKFTGDTQRSFLKRSTHPTIYIRGQTPIPDGQAMIVLSGDYITVDDNNDSEQLRDLGSMNDTDDGFAAYAISLLPTASQPHWLSIRNASEPQMVRPPFPPGSSQQTIVNTLEDLAGPIYQVYQYCTTINSAFASWAVIAGMN